MTSSPLWIVENLSASVWLWRILPALWRSQRARPVVSFVDSTPAGEWLARRTGGRLLGGLERLDFQFARIVDEQGRLVRLRISYQDLAEVRSLITAHPLFQEFLQEPGVRSSSLEIYLGKQVLSHRYPRRSVTRLIQLIQIAAWKKRETGTNLPIRLFAYRRLWRRACESYARRFGVQLSSTGFAPLNIGARLMDRIGEDRLKAVYYRILDTPAGRWWVRRYQRINSASSAGPAQPPVSGAKLWVEYYGHLNLERPELYSDVFFAQETDFKAADVLLSFGLPRDPLTREKYDELRRHGMTAVALNPRSCFVDGVPVYHHQDLTRKAPPVVSSRRNREARFLRRRAVEYQRQRDYWVEFFLRHQVKLATSWYKYDSRHCVITDALREAGGIATVYQRAFEEFPSAETVVAADVLFAFSSRTAVIEAEARSRIRQVVVVGYIGDHRFSALKAPAAVLRARLEKAGARQIIAYFDENSSDDGRWHTHHELTRSNYVFLLEKVLSTPSLGLIIKPKIAVTLRQRLGPVAALLARAEATGRCVVCEAGNLHTSYPPAFAAMASDLAIHGHLCAATAGFESALTGTPTLLLDREHWPCSVFYKSGGEGRVVFRDWDTLWSAFRAQGQDPSAVPGWGDWSGFLGDWDPFRDGRAGQRMGTYLSWLFEGLKDGRSRDRVLDEAAQRYAREWGADKVLTVG